ncbi:unnamed protein product [Oppiella nova]|uniref:Uncharacterized protein n=1 Tax=Oppiella nova TaxID=334625 RepID=A0A7R9MCK8_9ACAR|nr:unnamed protein product [Oppiella nova]CAG2173850.1 unnamed protein product [Oppiella nova]
MKRQPDRKNT